LHIPFSVCKAGGAEPATCWCKFFREYNLWSRSLTFPVRSQVQS
jgi:hypothetical protein